MFFCVTWKLFRSFCDCSKIWKTASHFTVSGTIRELMHKALTEAQICFEFFILSWKYYTIKQNPWNNAGTYFCAYFFKETLYIKWKYSPATRFVGKTTKRELKIQSWCWYGSLISTSYIAECYCLSRNDTIFVYSICIVWESCHCAQRKKQLKKTAQPAFNCKLRRIVSPLFTYCFPMDVVRRNRKIIELGRRRLTRQFHCQHPRIRKRFNA